MSTQLSRQMILLNQTDKMLNDLYHTYAASVHLSDSVLWVLYILWTEGDGLTQKEICDTWYYSRQTINTCLKHLEKEGYAVKSVNDGVSAINAFKQENPDLMILDIMLPKLDGWQVCREVRKFSDKPIIMLTAKGETFDKVLGLELGADDYMTKPFDTKEMVARIKAVLRRTSAGPAGEAVKEVNYENLSINLTNYEMKVNGKPVDTPPKELELIYHLASNPNRVFTRDNRPGAPVSRRVLIARSEGL